MSHPARKLPVFKRVKVTVKVPVQVWLLMVSVPLWHAILMSESISQNQQQRCTDSVPTPPNIIRLREAIYCAQIHLHRLSAKPIWIKKLFEFDLLLDFLFPWIVTHSHEKELGYRSAMDPSFLSLSSWNCFAISSCFRTQTENAQRMPLRLDVTGRVDDTRSRLARRHSSRSWLEQDLISWNLESSSS
jgi:hypothetical protein